MTTHAMLRIVRSQLAIDLNCTIDDLNGEKDSFIFTEVKDNPGRRPFPRSEQHYEMLSMGQSIVVSASPKILEIVKPLLDGKGRDEAFSAYLVNRLTLEILKRGYVPYYGTASSNIASQRVAHRSGYFPAWVCAYKGKFEGLECLPTG